MWDDMPVLTAADCGRDYLQAPVDDLYSFNYTMQWAAVLLRLFFVFVEL
jgi:hypothetical protein